MLRKEIRAFIGECREYWRKDNGKVAILKEQIVRLEAQNTDLMDRLLARSLPELKTFQLPVDDLRPEGYDPLEDENLAGEIVDLS